MDDYHDYILDQALREHRTDRCEFCGACNNGIVGTRYGYEVVCLECGKTLQEVDLDDVEEAAVYY